MTLPGPLGTLQVRLADAWRARAVSLKALSFATVGLINVAVDAIVFFLLIALLQNSAGAAKVAETLASATGSEFDSATLVIANVGAWLVAVTGSYVMNSLTTFSAETGGKLRLKDYAGFVGSGIVAVIATTTTVVIAAKFMPIWAAKALAILVSFAVNFSITHFVVFRPKAERTEG